MFKTFFIDFINIFKYSGSLFKETFKKQGIIWILIFIQTMLAIPLVYFYKEPGFSNLSILYKVLFVVALIATLILFFFMFKNVYNMASAGFKKENISNLRALSSLLFLGVLNCVPMLFFVIMYYFAKMLPDYGIIFKILLNILSWSFYFSITLSLASVVKWSEKNIFAAIWNGVKVFSKNLGMVILIFSIYFILSKILTFVFCTIIYSIAIYYNFISETLAAAVQMVGNIYSLYVIAGLYIGAQIKILGVEENEMLENNISQEQ